MSVVGPLLDAWQLRAVLAAIDGDVRQVTVLGPDEFSPYLRRLTPLALLSDSSAGQGFAWIIVPQGQLGRLSSVLLRALHAHFECVLENRRYALFRPVVSGHAHRGGATMRSRLEALLPEETGTAQTAVPAPYRWADRAILVTTCDRPAALERSLPQFARLGAPILVVDDGSRESLARRNEAAAEGCGAAYLRLPSNRGVSAALTVGLEFLLADRALEWISCIQDDAEVRDDILSVLHGVEDREHRPILTGYDAVAHPALDEQQVAGIPTLLKHETAGVHLHAHRDYWRGVLPIPTEYIGAPKRRWEAPLEDSWITVGAPASAGRRGIPVVCVPGLVRTFLWHPGDSSWDNPNAPEAALPPSGHTP